MFVYVTGTWLLANLIHPFLAIAIVGWTSPFDMNSFALILQFALFSIIFSIPSLALGQLAMYGIFQLPLRDTGKYILWLLIAPVLVLLNYWLLLLLFGGSIYTDSLDFLLPGMFSIVLIIIIRLVAFFKAAGALHIPKKN